MDLPGSFVQPFSTFFIFHSKWQMSYIYIHISLYIIFAVFQSFDHLTHFDNEIAGQPQAIPWPHAWPSWAHSSAWRCRSCWRWRRRPCHKDHSWNMLKAWNHPTNPNHTFQADPSCPLRLPKSLGGALKDSEVARDAKGKRSRNSAVGRGISCDSLGAGHLWMTSPRLRELFETTGWPGQSGAAPW